MGQDPTQFPTYEPGLLPRRFHTHSDSLTTILSKRVDISPLSLGENRGTARVSALAKVAGTRLGIPSIPARVCNCAPLDLEGWRPQTPRHVCPSQARERARSPWRLTAGREGATAAAPRAGKAAGAACAPTEPGPLRSPWPRGPQPCRPRPRGPPAALPRRGPLEQPPPGLARPPCSPRLPAAAPGGEGGRADWRRCALAARGSAARALASLPAPLRSAPPRRRRRRSGCEGRRGASTLPVRLPSPPPPPPPPQRRPA